MSKFEVGKFYKASDCGFDPIKIVKRTEKTIWVEVGRSHWAMRVRTDDDGEYAVDSSEPKKWRELLTYRASRPDESWK